MDRNQYRPSSIDSPASTGEAIAPNDAANLPSSSSYIHIEGAGTLHFEFVSGNEHTMTLAAGWHPLRIRKVFATGTTATGITGLWQV